MPANMLSDDERLIGHALQAASDTQMLRVEHGLRHRVAPAFQELFGRKPAVIVADTNTFAAAGKDVFDNFRRAGYPCLEPHVFSEPDLHAEYQYVESIERNLETHDAIPVAVGSGTINDLTKLAAHHLGRPYLVVATAASMDGYAAFGASITRNGSKQTFDCPAPAGVLADLEVIESAPEGMNASGYADLLAKIVAGADWIVADALAVEPIDRPRTLWNVRCEAASLSGKQGGGWTKEECPRHMTAWEMMHRRLRTWVDNPDGIRQGDPRADHCLVLGLVMSGLAMQRTRTSRIASGADHQFSHLWDMQNHVYQGKTPSHGFKVGIGTLASSALYEQLLPLPLADLDADRLASKWPDLPAVESDIQRRFDRPELTAKALEETRAKYVEADELREQLLRLRTVWPGLRDRLRSHLLPFDELRDRLTAAGCPSAPQEIGISLPRFRESYRQAYHIRRRFTVLDLAMRTGLFEPSLEQIFGPQGHWPIENAEN